VDVIEVIHDTTAVMSADELEGPEEPGGAEEQRQQQQQTPPAHSAPHPPSKRMCMRVFKSEDVGKYSAGQTFKPGEPTEGVITAVDAASSLVVVQMSNNEANEHTFLGYKMTTANPGKYRIHASFDNHIVRGIVMAVDHASNVIVLKEVANAGGDEPETPPPSRAAAMEDRQLYNTKESVALRAEGPQRLLNRTIQVDGKMGVVTQVMPSKLGSSTLHEVHFSSGETKVLQLAKKPGGKGVEFYVVAQRKGAAGCPGSKANPEIQELGNGEQEQEEEKEEEGGQNSGDVGFNVPGASGTGAVAVAGGGPTQR